MRVLCGLLCGTLGKAWQLNTHASWLGLVLYAEGPSKPYVSTEEGEDEEEEEESGEGGDGAGPSTNLKLGEDEEELFDGECLQHRSA